MALSVLVFVLVIVASLFHASWNSVVRKFSGNLSLMFLGINAFIICCLPFAIYFVVVDLSAITWQSVLLVIGTGVAHAVYTFCLAAAYAIGDISMVYPIARGSGIAMTSVLAFLVLKESITVVGWVGIYLIVVGVLVVGIKKETAKLWIGSIKMCMSNSSYKHVQTAQMELEDREDDQDESGGNNNHIGVELEDVEATEIPTSAEPATEHTLEQHQTGMQALKVLGIALAVGVSITSYSIIDKLGVARLNPVPYLCGMYIVQQICLVPFMVKKRKDEMIHTLKTLKKYCLFVGFAMPATYLTIVFAFTIENASYIVALREVSIVFGSIIGMVFLKEKFSIQKVVGMIFIVAGLVSVKIA